MIADWSQSTSAQITDEHRRRLTTLQANMMLEFGQPVTLRDALHRVIETGLSTLQPNTPQNGSQEPATNGVTIGQG